MHRFFVDAGAVDAAHGSVSFGPDQLRQMTRVLRLRPDETVIAVVPGGPGEAGREFIARPDGTVVAERLGQAPAPVPVTLFQGLPKGDRFELILQKATELGAAAVVPVLTERVVARPRPEQVPGKLTRWRAVAREAAEQCGRSDLPDVVAPVDWPAACAAASLADLALVPWENETAAGLKEIVRSDVSRTAARLRVAVLIGPEGGLSPREVEAARRSGVRPVGLGPRILRTETAAVAALTMVLYELGDLGRPRSVDDE
ncbi:MAG: RsmE family RNA methyltransferase [Bacillota bacterium]